MIYLVVFFILLYGAVKYDKQPNLSGAEKWFRFEWLVIVLLAGLRYKVGGDTLAYFDEFLTFPKLNELTKGDFTDGRYAPLWVLLFSTCRTLFNDFVYFQLIHAIFINTVFFNFITKNCKAKFSAVLIYFCMYFFIYNTEIIRASISCAIFLLSYNSLVNGKFFKYLLCTAIAVGFHYEAVCLLLFPIFYYLRKFKINSRTIIISFICTIILVALADIVPSISVWVKNLEVLSMYVGLYEDNIYSWDVNLFGYIMLIINFLPWAIALYFNKDNEDNLMNWLMLFFIIVQVLALRYPILVGRMRDFLYIISVVIIVNFFYKILKEKTSFVYLTILCAIILINGQVKYYSDIDRYKLFYPYCSIFNPKENIQREILFYEFQHQ